MTILPAKRINCHDTIITSALLLLKYIGDEQITVLLISTKTTLSLRQDLYVYLFQFNTHQNNIFWNINFSKKSSPEPEFDHC